MTATREALNWSAARCITGTDDFARQRAAFAEVEEWETRQAELERLCAAADLDFHNAMNERAAAEAEVARFKQANADVPYFKAIDALEAERDRLKDALADIADVENHPTELRRIARAALEAVT